VLGKTLTQARTFGLAFESWPLSEETPEEARMKIKQLSVQKLFGMFDHVVPFNLGERITIIHGSNGLGKTALLRMVNCFFSGKYSELREIPFSVFRIDFDNDSALQITRKDDGTKDGPDLERERSHLTAEYWDAPGRVPLTVEFGISVQSEYVRLLTRYLSATVTNVHRFGPHQWRLSPTGEILSDEELIERFWSHIPSDLTREARFPLGASASSESRDWLLDLRSKIDVRLIETQRLVALPKSPRKSRSDSPDTMTPAVAMYSDELANLIQAKFNEYARLSQALDQTFPMRVIDRNPSETLPLDVLRDRLNSLEKERERLRQAGLLDREAYYFLNVPPSIEEVTRRVLSVYAADMEKKLSVFKDLSEKIELLKKFVSDHFLSKELTISRERGFSLMSTRTNELLEATQLSSGEQHELVLFYELLFRLKPNSLILIDEPEISLHPDWQLQFLDDLLSILKLSDFDVLIATHSPMIINKRWDLAVELEQK
jgi:predicted ATPase